MGSRIRVATVVGTRPEIIKLSETIKLFDRVFEHVFVHTGQNYDYELNQVFFDGLGIREPDHYLGVVGENLGQTMGNVISKSYELFAQVRPDALLILGDTNSCLCAISAKRLKIPIFHMEAGNRCFDENLPEEVIRRIVDTTADVNLCYSEHARRNLLSMGCKPSQAMVVGSPMREVLIRNMPAIEGSTVLSDLGVEPGGFVLLSAHREENIDDDGNYAQLVETINAIAREYEAPVVYSVHPRTRKRIESEGTVFHPLVRQMRPFGFHDYCCLQRNALCVVSDSGTLAEESSILGFPAVSIRTSTERPEAAEAGRIVLGGIGSEQVLQAVRLAIALGDAPARQVDAYASECVSVEVAKIVQGFTGYVNKWTWGKSKS